jgi:hypothetical protein
MILKVILCDILRCLCLEFSYWAVKTLNFVIFLGVMEKNFSFSWIWEGATGDVSCGRRLAKSEPHI